MATSGPRPPRRPVVGSRNPTARPRRVAGQRPGEGPDPGQPGTDAAYPVPESERPTLTSVGPVDEPADPPAEEIDEPGERTRRMLGSRRTTVALVAALVLLSGAAMAEGWYLWLRDDPVVSAQRPVVTGEIAHRAAVEAASQGITEILSYNSENFDAEIEKATTMMTDEFAQQFRETASAIRSGFVKGHTEQEVKVVASSVVRGSSEKVEALLFLDQYVAKPGKGTSVTPFRALVTVEHTDSGWLVSNIETR